MVGGGGGVVGAGSVTTGVLGVLPGSTGGTGPGELGGAAGEGFDGGSTTTGGGSAHTEE